MEEKQRSCQPSGAARRRQLLLLLMASAGASARTVHSFLINLQLDGLLCSGSASAMMNSLHRSIINSQRSKTKTALSTLSR